MFVFQTKIRKIKENIVYIWCDTIGCLEAELYQAQKILNLLLFNERIKRIDNTMVVQ